jgi:hypothetical protein
LRWDCTAFGTAVGRGAEVVAAGFTESVRALAADEAAKIIEATAEWRAPPEASKGSQLSKRYPPEQQAVPRRPRPNAYANVARIYGLPDRPWGPARPNFGTIRYMNAAGFKRKFDMESYVQRVSKR